MASSDVEALLRRIPRLRVLSAFHCVQRAHVSISASEIKALWDAGRLFGFAGGTSVDERMGLAGSLQAVLPNSPLFLVTQETGRLVLGVQAHLGPCDVGEALSTLGRLPPYALGDKPARVRLIEEVGAITLSDLQRRGLRYLLHGDPHWIENLTHPLWVAAYQVQQAWERLWQSLLEAGSVRGKVLDRDVVDRMLPMLWPRVGIAEISPAAVLDEVWRVGVTRLNWQVLTSEDCQEVLSQVPDPQRERWCALPLHETIDGNRVAVIQHRTFLSVDAQITDDVLGSIGSVVLLKRSSHPTVAGQQSRWVPVLDWSELLHVLLGTESPHVHCRVILDALVALDHGRAELSPEVVGQLREVQWLLDANGAAVKPADVIDLEEITDEVERLVAASPGSYWTPAQMHPDIRCHPAFKLVRGRLTCRDRDGIQTLSLFLGEQYHICQVGLSDERVVEGLLSVLADVPADVNWPAWPLAADLARAYGTAVCREHFLANLGERRSAGEIAELLRWLNTRGPGDAWVREAYWAYLRALASWGQAALQHLTKFSLLTRADSWAGPESLCTAVEGLDGSSVLNDRDADILEGLVSPAGAPAVRERTGAPIAAGAELAGRATAGILDHFFRDWHDRVPSGLIAAFVFLLGSDEDTRRLARGLLGAHSLEWLEEKIPWNTPVRRSATAPAWLEGLGLREAIDKHKFDIHVVAGGTVRVRSLVGGPLDVRIDEQVQTVFVGGLDYTPLPGGAYRVKVALRRPDFSSYGADALGGLLKASVAYLLKRVFA